MKNLRIFHRKHSNYNNINSINIMNENQDNQKKDNTLLAIPGGLLFGVGAGFFFFPQGAFGVTSVFAFCGCIVGGLGIGMFAAAILASRKNKE